MQTHQNDGAVSGRRAQGEAQGIVSGKHHGISRCQTVAVLSPGNPSDTDQHVQLSLVPVEVVNAGDTEVLDISQDHLGVGPHLQHSEAALGVELASQETRPAIDNSAGAQRGIDVQVRWVVLLVRQKSDAPCPRLWLSSSVGGGSDLHACPVVAVSQRTMNIRMQEDPHDGSVIARLARMPECGDRVGP